jgi:hypothetical protein
MTLYNKLYQKNRPFLCIDSISRPARGVRTERKDWGVEPRNWTVSESTYVVDRINYKTVCRALVIIDIMENKVVKSRFDPAESEQILTHYLTKYQDKVIEAMHVWKLRSRLDSLEKTETVNA